MASVVPEEPVPMSKSQRFIWELYFLVVLLFTVRKSFSFFDPQSDVYLYFEILTSFDSGLKIIYLFNLLQIIFNVIQFLPLALFIYDKKLLTAIVWQIFFSFKVAFDLVGHTFESNILLSLWHSDTLLTVGIFVSSTAIYVPAYIALFLYAFCQKKLKLEKIH